MSNLTKNYKGNNQTLTEQDEVDKGKSHDGLHYKPTASVVKIFPTNLEEDQEVLFLRVSQDLRFKVLQNGHTEVDLQTLIPSTETKDRQWERETRKKSPSRHDYYKLLARWKGSEYQVQMAALFLWCMLAIHINTLSQCSNCWQLILCK